MPTIDIVILALIVGGALVFMAEMIWFSMDRHKLPRDGRGRPAPGGGVRPP